jgi:hypothetical protein
VGVLVYAVATAVSVLLSFIGAILRRRRRMALAAVARQFQLDYAVVDLLGLIDHRFDLFNKADGARTENVVWGDWKGVRVEAGELWFESQQRRWKRSVARIGRFSLAFVDVPAALPHLTLERGATVAITNSLGLSGITTESEVFNRTFRVSCSDREFAYSFLDIRMILWLLQVAAHYPIEFEVSGSRLLAYMPRLRPGELPQLLGLAKGFHDHVPQMVLWDYTAAGHRGR